MARQTDLQRAAEMLAGIVGPGVALRTRATDSPTGLLVELTPTIGIPVGDRPISTSLTLKPWSTWASAQSTHVDTTVWVLRRGTPALRQRLRESGANFLDLTGATRLQLPWLIVDRTDLPRAPTPHESPPSVNPFGDHNSRVVRVMLESHPSSGTRQALTSSASRGWGVRELASAAGVDRTTTSRILRRLAAWQLVRIDKRGRAIEARIVDPVRLIDRWSSSYDWTANTSLAVHAPVGFPNRFLARLPSLLEDAMRGRRWALTLHAGASLLAPHATWDRLHLYVDVEHERELREIASSAGWRPGDDGNVVLMRPYYRTSVWQSMQSIDGLVIVSAVQLLVDLWQYPLRGREQAEHLLDLLSRPDRQPTTQTSLGDT